MPRADSRPSAITTFPHHHFLAPPVPNQPVPSCYLRHHGASQSSVEECGKNVAVEGRSCDELHVPSAPSLAFRRDVSVGCKPGRYGNGSSRVDRINWCLCCHHLARKHLHSGHLASTVMGAQIWPRSSLPTTPRYPRPSLFFFENPPHFGYPARSRCKPSRAPWSTTISGGLGDHHCLMER